uniref:Uncharacterized protein n=1 Tax=Anopheles culicifacies TaxID=139723 RepID=A0A182MPB1_9DIPT
MKSVTWPSTCRTMSSARSLLPGLRSTIAIGRSDDPSGEGIPITHTCFTPSICCMMPSRSDGDTWKLLYLMMSLMRSTTYRLPSVSMYPMSPLRKNPSSVAIGVPTRNMYRWRKSSSPDIPGPTTWPSSSTTRHSTFVVSGPTEPGFTVTSFRVMKPISELP